MGSGFVAVGGDVSSSWEIGGLNDLHQRVHQQHLRARKTSKRVFKHARVLAGRARPIFDRFDH